jgi:hypothetical protein
MSNKQVVKNGAKISIERVQTGVRMEKRLVKVLKAVAEYHDLSLGELIESIALHAFDEAPAFHEKTLKHIAQLKEIYGMDYERHDNHRFIDMSQPDN